jgi:hypothetical protein
MATTEQTTPTNFMKRRSSPRRIEAVQERESQSTQSVCGGSVEHGQRFDAFTKPQFIAI